MHKLLFKKLLFKNYNIDAKMDYDCTILYNARMWYIDYVYLYIPYAIYII
jgi:hypothetical protein